MESVIACLTNLSSQTSVSAAPQTDPNRFNPAAHIHVKLIYSIRLFVSLLSTAGQSINTCNWSSPHAFRCFRIQNCTKSFSQINFLLLEHLFFTQSRGKSLWRSEVIGVCRVQDFGSFTLQTSSE